jgi:translation initiation factor 5B
MAPKKKSAKKDQDDWENDLGESIDPIAEATKKAKEEEGAEDGEGDEAGGGLLAALKKNRARKVKKGKAIEDYVEGEDPAQENGEPGAPAEPAVDLSAKAPVEADMDDEDVFGQPVKKGKGGKAQQKSKEPEDDDEQNAGGHLKTKKEKEKEKKEREKQRKKEQVR